MQKLKISIKDEIKTFVQSYVNGIKFEKGFKLRGHVYTKDDLTNLLQKDANEKLFARMNILRQHIMNECKLGKNSL